VESVVVNSGFFDLRKKITNFSPGQKFVLFYKPYTAKADDGYEGNLLSKFKVEVGEKIYESEKTWYKNAGSTIDKNIFLTFDTSNPIPCPIDGYKDYQYVIASVPDNYAKTEEEFGYLKI
jgi:hypothetical protein